jgi:hypothetical protein
MVVYCDTDQQIGEGFATALHLMGLESNFLPVEMGLAHSNPEQEDN